MIFYNNHINLQYKDQASVGSTNSLTNPHRSLINPVIPHGTCLSLHHPPCRIFNVTCPMARVSTGGGPVLRNSEGKPLNIRLDLVTDKETVLSIYIIETGKGSYHMPSRKPRLLKQVAIIKERLNRHTRNILLLLTTFFLRRKKTVFYLPKI